MQSLTAVRESRAGARALDNGGQAPSLRSGPRVAGWCLAAIALVLVAAPGTRPASAQNLLLDTFTNAGSPVGVFSGTATRSFIGYSGGVSINTTAGEARLVADDIETPTYSGLAYAFSPSTKVRSSVIVTARNREPNASATGLLSIRSTTSAGTYTMSSTLPGSTPTMQTYTFDFTALAGSTMTLQGLDVTWDLPPGGTGLRGLAIAQIDLVASPLALVWNTSSGTWNTATTNWTTSGGGAYAFAPDDSVTFSGTAGGTVSISGSLAPAAIAVSASSGTYSFISSSGNLITGTAGLTKSGNGTLVLTGSNGFSGAATLSAGTIRVGHDGALGSGSLGLNGGTLASDSATSRTLSNAVAVGGDFTVGDGTGTGAVGFGGGVNLGGATRSITTVADTTFSGAISNGGLTKLGAGKLTLSGSSTYSDPTTVQAGTLALSGTLANSAVTVNGGAVLSGNGFIGSSLTVLSSGTLSPGNSPGQITIGTLSLQAGSTTLLEIVGSTTSGTDYDTLVVTGSSGLTYGGALSIVFSNAGSFATGTTFDLFQFTGSAAGNFASITTDGSGVYAGLNFSPNPDGFWYSGDTSGSQYLRFSPTSGDLVVVPEPSTWVAAVMGITCAAGFARRRRV